MTEPYPPELLTADDKNFAMIAHLAVLSFYFTIVGAAVGPLIVWLMKKDGSAFVDEQGKEAINFGINVIGWTVVSFLIFFTIILIPVAIVIWVVGGLLAIILPIIAALKARDGVPYRYPLIVRAMN